ncbi:hypothetical protein POTOM_038724 [Populus tomentosa]|uniref:Uncharacterized protein n=1 Tax=Populus tomentosa TaxID=118781 RepID=A0A8X8CLK4_POPTO|nr:hypothetical protein POTOM_038724 [Populus tomentosa]
MKDSIKKQNADANGRGLSLGGAIFVQLSLSDTFESISMGWFRAGCRVARVPIRKTVPGWIIFDRKASHALEESDFSQYNL